MKIALYIEDGLEQIVLTPESETEKGILGKLHDDSRELSIKQGSFYNCQGGWTRYEPAWTSYTYGEQRHADESTMIVLRELRDSGSGSSERRPAGAPGETPQSGGEAASPNPSHPETPHGQ